MNGVTFSLIGKSAYISKNQTNTKTQVDSYSNHLKNKIYFGDAEDIIDLDTSAEGQLQRLLIINPNKDSLPIVKLKTYITFNLPIEEVVEELLREKKAAKEIEVFLSKLKEIEAKLSAPDCDDD